VSLIEQAAKRLEELRKSGADVSVERVDNQADEPGNAHAPVSARGPSRNPAVELPAAAESAPAGVTSPRRENAQATSRAVRIDLARLAAAGFVTPDTPRTQLAADFRPIKRPLLANAQSTAISRPHNANLVMVTSAVAREGKSFTALNLAMSMAMELDNTVLLVDADVANPAMLEILGLPASKGLMDVLTDSELDLSSVILKTNVDNLTVLPAGARHPRATELLASDVMTHLVDEMAVRYPDRIIVFDSPPLLLTTESPVLATHMGQIVVVVEAERTAESTLMLALAKIEKCPIVMTLLNKATNLGPYYRYGYGYDYVAEQGPAKDGE
jgi:exopolysaccharide/PEP-CTERM locus tyrosine autokinase